MNDHRSVQVSIVVLSLMLLAIRINTTFSFPISSAEKKYNLAGTTVRNTHDSVLLTMANNDYVDQYNNNNNNNIENYPSSYSPSSSSSSSPSSTPAAAAASPKSGSSKSARWSATDDWNSLSSQNTQIESDIARDQNIALMSAMKDGMHIDHSKLSEDDIWINDAIEAINTETIVPNGVALYDTLSSSSGSCCRSKTSRKTKAGDDDNVKQIAYEDEMGKQIAMLVRCNEKPEAMNIEQGRVLKELTEEQKNDVSQLVVEDQDTEQIVPTPFFVQTVTSMFQQHALKEKVQDENENDIYAMDAKSVATWLEQSTTGKVKFKIGQYDRSVRDFICKHSTYGTGKIYIQNFMSLYFKAIVGEKNTKPTLYDLMHRPKFINAVFRDIRNHQILTPVEIEREIQLNKLAKEQEIIGNKKQHDSDSFISDTFMDECEILDWGKSTEEPESKILRKSSHLDVQMSILDNETPVFIKDGEFVYIDEESCIGCNQCASESPSSFMMLEDGRARMYSQSNTPDVDRAIQSCPVDCMHYVSFEELKKFETARDQGDGRTDHKHFTPSKGNVVTNQIKLHTPLHVSRRDSSANHKSSWYHMLRNKCYTSSTCPQAGCYDCPYYNRPGMNPNFKLRLKKTQHNRAQHFIESGEADPYRKTGDL